MFTKLLASGNIRHKSGGGLGASVAIHGWLVIGAVMGTVNAHRPPEPRRVYRVTYVPPAAPVRPRTAPVVRTIPRADPGTTTADVISIQPPTLTPLLDIMHAAVGEPNAAPFVRLTGGGVGGIAPPPTSGGAYRVEQVDEPVVIDKGSPLPRFPAAMRSAGVEGSARVQFVVDTLGRVEMASVREMESTHSAFALAVRGTLPRMRFVPAKVGGRAVRQLVEFPIVFRIER